LAKAISVTSAVSRVGRRENPTDRAQPAAPLFKLLNGGLSMINLTVNDRAYSVDADPATPLLWVLRDHLALTGTKYGCGIAQCGACTVHLDGNAARSCATPLSAVGSRPVTTIEGLARNGKLHPVQSAWIEEQVPQCGYCQSGQIMTAVALLKDKPRPTDADIDQGMAGIICRCGTYPRIRKAIHRLAQSKA
jgi:aerobic-type carbon monoxide dehydrogenase small subunit (CoxS/CutS family)